MSRARKLQMLFMSMQINLLTKEDLIKQLREIYEVELDEPDTALVVCLMNAAQVVEQAEGINKELGDISNQVAALRFKL